jgi:hypothetical protein
MQPDTSVRRASRSSQDTKMGPETPLETGGGMTIKIDPTVVRRICDLRAVAYFLSEDWSIVSRGLP